MVAESEDPYPSHSPPLVQQPSRGNTSFHSPIEGHVYDTTSLDYGPNAPFWDTSIGQAIASFGTHLNFSEEVSPNEEERRQYQVAILHAQEIHKKIEDILGTPPPRSAVVPVGYRSLVDSMRPIEPIIDHPIIPHNPCQNTNPTTSHVMSIPNIPWSFSPRSQHSIPVSSLPSGAEGKPPAQPMLSRTRIVPSEEQTSGIEKSIVYVPPTF